MFSSGSKRAYGLSPGEMDWLAFDSLAQTRAAWEVETSTEELCPSAVCLWACLAGIFMIKDWCGRAQAHWHPWGGGPGLDKKAG